MTTMVIGQGADCDLRVADPYVSNRHASIRRDDNGAYWIEDLGSTNGTFLERGGIRLQVYGPRQLRTGDIIWLGRRTPIPWQTS